MGPAADAVPKFQKMLRVPDLVGCSLTALCPHLTFSRGAAGTEIHSRPRKPICYDSRAMLRVLEIDPGFLYLNPHTVLAVVIFVVSVIENFPNADDLTSGHQGAVGNIESTSFKCYQFTAVAALVHYHHVYILRLASVQYKMVLLFSFFFFFLFLKHLFSQQKLIFFFLSRFLLPSLGLQCRSYSHFQL